MTTKKQFLLKQTEEQRAQLDTLAENAPSVTAYIQGMLDDEWRHRQHVLDAHAYDCCKVCGCSYSDNNCPVVTGKVVSTRDCSKCAQALSETQVTKALPAGDPGELLAPTPCACDGNCYECSLAEVHKAEEGNGAL